MRTGFPRPHDTGADKSISILLRLSALPMDFDSTLLEKHRVLLLLLASFVRVAIWKLFFHIRTCTFQLALLPSYPAHPPSRIGVVSGDMFDQGT